MATRRNFTFGSLVLAMAGPTAARAGGPARTAPPLEIGATGRREGDQLIVELTVTNPTADPIEILAGRGSGPGPWVGASIVIDDQPFELAAVFDGDRRDLISRIGPIPRWAPLAAGATESFGPYRFQWPHGVPDRAITLKGGGRHRGVRPALPAPDRSGPRATATQLTGADPQPGSGLGSVGRRRSADR